jgi:hypothetical protein
MPRHNNNAIELMRAITENAIQGGFDYRLGSGWSDSLRDIHWPRDPHANPQRAELKMSDGTWLTVTVEQSEEKPS